MDNGLVNGGKRLGLFIIALGVVLVTRLTLSLASHRLVLRLIPRGHSAVAHPKLAARVSMAVAAAARIVPRASCLTQALSVQFILACRGYASEVKIGVKRGEDGAVEAHAWLLSGGFVAIGGSPAELAAYIPLAELTPN